MLIMLLTEEQLLIQESARALADKSIRPFALTWDQQKNIPKTALQPLAQAGFMGMLIPSAWDGANIDHIAYTLVISELAKACGALSTLISVHNSVASLPILHFGNDWQKDTFLRPMARGEKLGAFCLSEPQAGSDASNLQTKAIRDGDEFVIQGVKQFVTSGQQADIAIVFATTDPAATQNNITAFIVPTNTPGYQVAKIEKKMGQHACEIAQIVFDDCRIPATNQLGELGQGYKIALHNLECGRLGIAAQAIGMAEEALALSLQYAQERKTFGKFLYEHQSISFTLADMATQLMAAKQLLYHAATLRDQKLRCLKEVSMAKLFATEVAEKICRQAMQIYGGYGYLEDFPLERLYRDVRVTSIYEGSSEIQRMIIGRELIQN
jgi:hypothetical protein